MRIKMKTGSADWEVESSDTCRCRHNEDGSYTYGYEGADGSFKIETKLTTGDVMGKYGYVDDLGKVRVVEYGANKYGFQPAGEGITVAPPTLVDETKRPREGPTSSAVDYDDGQYYEEPQVRSQAPARFSPPRPAPARFSPPRPAPAPRPAQESYSYDTYSEPPSAPRPSPPRHSSNGPVPPRAQIPGAIPAGGSSTGIVYSQPRPAPKPHGFTQAIPAVRPDPEPPVYRPQPIPPSRPQARQTGGILDQLAKDYALPPGGQPYHDITFGFY
jgi:hypothetical protein